MLLLLLLLRAGDLPGQMVVQSLLENLPQLREAICNYCTAFNSGKGKGELGTGCPVSDHRESSWHGPKLCSAHHGVLRWRCPIREISPEGRQFANTMVSDLLCIVPNCNRSLGPGSGSRTVFGMELTFSSLLGF